MAYGSDGSDGWDGVDGVGDVDGSDVAAQTMRFTQVSILNLLDHSGEKVVLAWCSRGARDSGKARVGQGMDG
jgi:hypothetical protein